MKVQCMKQEFFRNRENKMQLIQLLITTFKREGINVTQSQGDADVMICKKALQQAEQGSQVEVSGKDTDLLVILVHHWRQGMNLFFRTSCKESKTLKDHAKTMWWSVEHIAKDEFLRKHILFGHIWSGCDTTSAIYGQGTFLSSYVKLVILISFTSIFCYISCILVIYQSFHSNSINIFF